MKFIINENQYELLLMEGCPPNCGVLTGPIIINHSYNTGKEILTKLRSKYPDWFDFVVQAGLWFVPYVGPYLSTAYGAGVSIEKIVRGNKTKNNNLIVEGVIELITSPLAMMKAAKIMKIMGDTSKTQKMLEAINKSGLPLLISKGQEQFLKWGVDTFKEDFLQFIGFINDQSKLKNLLSSIYPQQQQIPGQQIGPTKGDRGYRVGN